MALKSFSSLDICLTKIHERKSKPTKNYILTFYLYISKQYIMHLDTFLKNVQISCLRCLKFLYHVSGTERTSTNSIHAAKIQVSREESEFHRCWL